jgi:hypothetical protein
VTAAAEDGDEGGGGFLPGICEVGGRRNLLRGESNSAQYCEAEGRKDLKRKISGRDVNLKFHWALGCGTIYT